MAGEIVGDQIEISQRIGVFDGVKQADVPDGVARARGQCHLLPIPDAQGTVDPDLLDHLCLSTFIIG